MPPTPPISDVVNMIAGNPELGGQCDGVASTSSDLLNRIGRQLSPMHFLTPDLSPLAIAISHVVGLCAEEQMVGVDATTDITLMANKKTIGDRTVRQFPGNTMRSDTAPIDLHSAVAEAAHHPNPEGATSGTGNGETPEALRKTPKHSRGSSWTPLGRLTAQIAAKQTRVEGEISEPPALEPRAVPGKDSFLRGQEVADVEQAQSRTPTRWKEKSRHVLSGKGGASGGIERVCGRTGETVILFATRAWGSGRGTAGPPVAFPAQGGPAVSHATPREAERMHCTRWRLTPYLAATTASEPIS
jgi:hypothetical protein